MGAVFGSINASPHIAHAMDGEKKAFCPKLCDSCLVLRFLYPFNDLQDFNFNGTGYDILAGDYHVDSLCVSGLEENPHTFWMLVKKVWVPFLLFTIVMVNWKNPIKLVVNAIFFIFTTKPRPFSVYLAVEQVRG